MTERHNLARGANEWADTYGSLGAAAPAQLTRLPLGMLDPWKGNTGEPQPFKAYSKEKLEELAENIRKNGVIEPICVRPMPSGRFQIIAGHNRVEASKIADLTTIPALVQQLDDAQASILMVDSNLQHRDVLLPSEKAFAYKLRFEAVKKQRSSTNTEGAPVEHLPSGVKSRDILAEESDDSREQIRRYIRLTKLHPVLLELVDNTAQKPPYGQKKLPQIAVRSGVDLSYLRPEEQSSLVSIMEQHKIRSISMTQAQELRSDSKRYGLNQARILSILRPAKGPKPETSIKLPAGRISGFFPPNTSPEQMEAEIYEALLAYRKNNNTPASA